MVICCFFKHRKRTWSLFSEPLSLQFLQFKEKLQSRTEPSLACWSMQIRVTPSLSVAKRKQSLLTKSSQLFSPSSFAVSSACYSLSVPLLLLNVSESLHPGLPALLNNWPGQLALTAACHLIFGLCPSGRDFSMALSFWKPAVLFLNQSLSCLCVTIQKRAHWNQNLEFYMIIFWHWSHFFLLSICCVISLFSLALFTTITFR